MFDLSSVVSTKKLIGPPRLIVYGAPGVGKTTLATAFPRPYLIRTEDGGNSLRFRDVATKDGDPCGTYHDAEEQVDALIECEHNFATLVIDSLDWLGALIEREICDQLNIRAIADLDYGRGYARAVELWRAFFARLELLRSRRGVMIVFTAHAAAVEQRDPDGEKFTTWGLKLTKGAAAVAIEWADEVWYLCADVHASTERGAQKNAPRIGKGTSDRVIRVSCAPGYVAKTRQLLRSEYRIGQDRNFSEILQAFFNGEQ